LTFTLKSTTKED